MTARRQGQLFGFQAPDGAGVSFLRDEDGAVIVLFSLVLPVLIGVAALAVDVSQLLSAKNLAQGAADNAAVSAVAAAANAGGSLTDATTEARAVASLNGFAHGQNGVAVVVYNPPRSGAYANEQSAYEVTVTQAQTTSFGRSSSVQARAVAIPGATPCIIALAPSGKNTLNVNGGVTVTTNCEIYANSSDKTAVTLSGTVNAPLLSIVGNYTVSGSGVVNAKVDTGVEPVRDPYASLAVPSFGACNYTNATYKKSATISPGVYCGGIAVSSGATVTMNPGLYIINGGGFTITGSGTMVTGAGVSIVVTKNANAVGNWNNIDISGGGSASLTAMESGPMEGILFYLDRAAPTAANKMTGGSTQSFVGTIYMPSQDVSFTGNSSTGRKCAEIIARTITFSGHASFGIACAGAPGPLGRSRTGKLVE